MNPIQEDPPGPPMEAIRWRGAETIAAEDCLLASCGSCRQSYLVHRDLAGFRIRCHCQAMIAVPALLSPTAAALSTAGRAPRAVAQRTPWSSRGRRTEPADGAPEISLAQELRGINRVWIQFILILLALVGPQLVLLLVDGGPRQVRWWPLASLASGVLITGIGMLWPRTAFALLRRPSLLATLQAIALGISMALLALGYMHLLGHDHDLAELTSPLGLPSALFVIAVCPGIFEELAFRGMIQGTLTTIWGRYLGWCCTAGIFAVCHGATLGLPFQFALGLLLGWLRTRNQSLLPGMAMHMVYNGVLVASSFAA